ncbi:MAG: TetR/AcrR family transcriptional regulator, partial [Phenylobacterium sp.]
MTRQTQEPDGRRRRGLDSRDRIIAAMLDLAREGEVAPGAERVAARAEVGLRTVFRHFRDMDSL